MITYEAAYIRKFIADYIKVAIGAKGVFYECIHRERHYVDYPALNFAFVVSLIPPGPDTPEPIMRVRYWRYRGNTPNDDQYEIASKDTWAALIPHETANAIAKRLEHICSYGNHRIRPRWCSRF